MDRDAVFSLPAVDLERERQSNGNPIGDSNTATNRPELTPRTT